MPWNEPWPLKVRRHARKLALKLSPPRRHYVTDYMGASFLVPPRGVGSLELSAKIWEKPEVLHLIDRARALRPDMLIDAGANIGVYSCILLKQNVIPQAQLFEPDRENQISLRANLLMNGLLERAEVHEFALGAENSRHRLYPGHVAKGDMTWADGGNSMIVESDIHVDETYEVAVVRFDDHFDITGKTLLVKIDTEHYELKVLKGMARTLAANRCVVQVETFALKDELFALMAGFGYAVTARFAPNFVFEKLST